MDKNIICIIGMNVNSMNEVIKALRHTNIAVQELNIAFSNCSEIINMHYEMPIKAINRLDLPYSHADFSKSHLERSFEDNGKSFYKFINKPIGKKRRNKK